MSSGRDGWSGLVIEEALLDCLRYHPNVAPETGVFRSRHRLRIADVPAPKDHDRVAKGRPSSLEVAVGVLALEVPHTMFGLVNAARFAPGTVLSALLRRPSC